MGEPERVLVEVVEAEAPSVRLGVGEADGLETGAKFRLIVVVGVGVWVGEGVVVVEVVGRMELEGDNEGGWEGEAEREVEGVLLAEAPCVKLGVEEAERVEEAEAVAEMVEVGVGVGVGERVGELVTLLSKGTAAKAVELGHWYWG